MKYRKLRIAWSVVCGVLCLLLIALWVRSLHVADSLTFPITAIRMLGVESLPGELSAYTNHYVPGYYGPLYGREYPWNVRNDEVKWYHHRDRTMDDFRGAFGIGVRWSPPLYVVVAPHWFCVLIISGLAIAPWVRYRFSLRTFLISLTILALILGTIITTTR